MEIESEAVVEGFARARWPGRLEACPGQPRLWWDGAHNPDGFAALAGAWREDLRFEPPEAVVLALAQDKDAGAIARLLGPWVTPARIIATQSRSARALPAGELRARLGAEGLDAQEAPGVAEAVEAALAGAPNGRVLLCGSLVAGAEAMEAFGGAPGEWL